MPETWLSNADGSFSCVLRWLRFVSCPCHRIVPSFWPMRSYTVLELLIRSHKLQLSCLTLEWMCIIWSCGCSMKGQQQQ